MSNPLETGAKRVAYGLSQAARIGWYSLHYFAGRHAVAAYTPPGHVPPKSRFAPYDRDELVRIFRELFREEWRNIEAGVYKLPHDMRRLPDLPAMLSKSGDYMREAANVSRRAHRKGGHSEVLDAELKEKYPRYYLQNFHFQSGGWLTDESARIYDTQVETLFTGAADAMRRQALPFIRDELIRLRATGQSDSETTFVDLACGTGRLLSFVKDNFPELPATAIDLSPEYLEEAKRQLAPWPGITFVEGKAEEIPLADISADILVTVYLFHELPPRVRQEVAAEIARILKPGGLYLHVDTIQYGDCEGVDVLLENFPRAFHEPYYDSYAKEDLETLLGEVGLAEETEKWGFLTKVSAFRKEA